MKNFIIIKFALFLQGFPQDSSYHQRRTSSGFTSNNPIASLILIEPGFLTKV
ncbi:MAG: hypothetical protein HWQ23_24470 [Nostoc sp. JL33]|uniref:hypothetical protein n=1 Tax=Nostoc sp. JL33 TaxID=2815396 RepID=UPI0025ECE177|nr:hypothetical protein [Nostoc sp. JL33]MBN3873308.1 hypothetical protein [Nostoc sp. JL33]